MPGLALVPNPPLNAPKPPIAEDAAPGAAKALAELNPAKPLPVREAE